MDYETYMMIRTQREFDECECFTDCDLCERKECGCGSHQKDCATCQTRRGCRCDQIYDEWRDEQVWVVP